MPCLLIQSGEVSLQTLVFAQQSLNTGQVTSKVIGGHQLFLLFDPADRLINIPVMNGIITVNFILVMTLTRLETIKQSTGGIVGLCSPVEALHLCRPKQLSLSLQRQPLQPLPG